MASVSKIAREWAMKQRLEENANLKYQEYPNQGKRSILLSKYEKFLKSLDAEKLDKLLEKHKNR